MDISTPRVRSWRAARLADGVGQPSGRARTGCCGPCCRRRWMTSSCAGIRAGSRARIRTTARSGRWRRWRRSTPSPGDAAVVPGPGVDGGVHRLAVGRVIALRRRDLDLDAGFVTVRSAVVGIDSKLEGGRPKSLAGVRRSACPPAAAELREHVRRWAESGSHGRVSRGERRDAPAQQLQPAVAGSGGGGGHRPGGRPPLPRPAPHRQQPDPAPASRTWCGASATRAPCGADLPAHRSGQRAGHREGALRDDPGGPVRVDGARGGPEAPGPRSEEDSHDPGETL